MEAGPQDSILESCNVRSTFGAESLLPAQGVVPEPSTPEETKAAIQQDYQWNAAMVQRFD
jgi:hypothetical protein